MTLNKKWLFIILVIIITISGCSKDDNEVVSNDDNLTMYITTDIHYLAPSMTDGGKAYQDYLVSGDGRQLNYIEEIVSAFANDISKKQPDVLIVSGDLTNNGEKENHIKLSQKFKKIEETSVTKVFVIPGNHDILNPWARRFQGENQYKTDTISPDEFMKIYEDFGYGEAISKDTDSLSYLAAPSEDLWLLMLDTNEYELNEEYGMPTTNGMISDETFDWIKECSKMAKENHAQIVTVMHHNLLKHNERLYYGFTLDNSDKAVDVFHESGLNLVLSGHIHVQDIKSTAIDNSSIYDIVTSALCAFPQQYGILQYIPSEGFDYSTARVDVEAWAKDTGVNDDNLINFRNYSQDYYKESSYNKTYKRLSKLGIYSEQDIKLMSETVSLLNSYYFAGSIDSIKNEVLNSQGYELWLDATEPEYLKEYVINMVTKESINSNNKLFIPVIE